MFHDCTPNRDWFSWYIPSITTIVLSCYLIISLLVHIIVALLHLLPSIIGTLSVPRVNDDFVHHLFFLKFRNDFRVKIPSGFLCPHFLIISSALWAIWLNCRLTYHSLTSKAYWTWCLTNFALKSSESRFTLMNGLWLSNTASSFSTTSPLVVSLLWATLKFSQAGYYRCFWTYNLVAVRSGGCRSLASLTWPIGWSIFVHLVAFYTTLLQLLLGTHLFCLLLSGCVTILLQVFLGMSECIRGHDLALLACNQFTQLRVLLNWWSLFVSSVSCDASCSLLHKWLSVSALLYSSKTSIPFTYRSHGMTQSPSPYPVISSSLLFLLWRAA